MPCIHSNDSTQVNFTPSAAVDAGSVVVEGDLIGIADLDVAAGELGAYNIRGQYIVPKVTTDVVTKGAKLYWDATAVKATVTAGTLPYLGLALEAASGTATSVLIYLGA